jgi:ABC-type phosphate transport system substrate-binding protein
MRAQKILFPFLLALSLAAGADAAAGYKLVVNAANPTQHLTRSEVARIFLKKVGSWPDGHAIAAVDQDRTSEVRKTFSEAVHQKDPDAISAYWQVLVFSGRDVPPKTLKSDAEVLEFVKSHAGAVGYVSSVADADGVRVVTVQ